jgi:signal recognition particle subunit SRP54
MSKRWIVAGIGAVLLGGAVVGGAALIGTGDEPGPAAIRITPDGGGGDALSARAEGALGADRMAILPYWRDEFVVVGELPPLDGPAPVWVSQQATVTAEDAARIAAALGVAGEPVLQEWGAWTVGPSDGSGPNVTVSTTPLGDWWYSNPTLAARYACPEPAPAPDGTGDATTSDVAVLPDCPEPQPPTDLPSDEEALAEAQRIADAVGGVGGDDQLVTRDEWGVNVERRTRLGGIETPFGSTIRLGSGGIVEYASGFLGSFEQAGEYPRIGTAEAFARLQAGQPFPWMVAQPLLGGDAAVSGEAGAVEGQGAGEVAVEPAVEPVAPGIVDPAVAACSTHSPTGSTASSSASAARGRSRGGRRRGPARDPPRPARGRRQLQGRRQGPMLGGAAHPRAGVGEESRKALNPASRSSRSSTRSWSNALGGETIKITYASKPPTVVLMAGLQGSGKTTNTAKLARWFKQQGRNPLLVGADLQRPAAVEQLRTLGRQIDVPVFSEPGDPVEVARRQGLEEARRSGRDVLIVDTAGRLAIDAELMEQVRQISDRRARLHVPRHRRHDRPGRRHRAESFHETLALDGVILTKLDGDARGGAALSVKEVVGKPIAFASTGEKLDDFELFHPDRLAGRILGMGDMLTLIEKAEQVYEKEEAEEAAAKLMEGSSPSTTSSSRCSSSRRWARCQSLLGMMPGMPKELKNAEIDDKELARVEAIIRSMTPEERANPELIDGSRRTRIANGSG